MHLEYDPKSPVEDEAGREEDLLWILFNVIQVPIVNISF